MSKRIICYNNLILSRSPCHFTFFLNYAILQERQDAAVTQRTSAVIVSSKRNAGNTKNKNGTNTSVSFAPSTTGNPLRQKHV